MSRFCFFKRSQNRLFFHTFLALKLKIRLTSTNMLQAGMLSFIKAWTAVVQTQLLVSDANQQPFEIKTNPNLLTKLSCLMRLSSFSYPRLPYFEHISSIFNPFFSSLDVWSEK